MNDPAVQRADGSARPRVAVLMTCHNRVSCTIQSVGALKAQMSPGASMDVFLVDDGSSDGTGRAVAEILPDAHILRGDGDLFWSGGIRLAFERAMKENYDFYLWLNDDTNLDLDALTRLIATYREVSPRLGKALIVVGSTRDPDTGLFSYGGWCHRERRLGLKSWVKITPDMEHPISCDTINGNCVLIPRSVVERIGNLDAVFRHALGDIDYGLRAVKNGCQIVIAPGYFGTCRRNDGSGLWTDKSLRLISRWKRLIGPKGLPVKAWGVFSYRHKGRFWFLSWLAPYILIWFDVFSSSSKDKK